MNGPLILWPSLRGAFDVRIAGESGLLSLAAIRAAAPPTAPPVGLPLAGAGQATPPTASAAGPPPRVAPFASQTLSALLGLQGAEAPDKAPDAELSEICLLYTSDAADE